MRNLHILVAVLILFSYPIATVWLIQLGLSTSEYNLALKAGIVALCGYGLLLYRPPAEPLSGAMVPLLAFFFLFGMRLLYDVLVLGIVDVFQTRTYVFGYFFGLTFLPAIFLALRLRGGDLDVLHRALVIGLVLANVSLLFFASTRNLTAETMFAGRVEQAGEVQGTDVLGPIMVGHMGALLAAYAMGRLAVDQTLSLTGQLVHAGFLLLGAANILFGGSRGPAVAVALAFLIIAYTLVTSPFRRGRLPARGSAWIYAAFAIFGLIYLLAFTEQDIFLFDRFESLYLDQTGGGIEERNIIYALAWSDFLSSPLIGSGYVVSIGGYSAHNFVLEALMATGVVGGMLFAVAIFRALRGIWRLLHGSMGAKGYTLALIAVCLFVVGGTSGSVRESPELWIMATIMTIIGNRPLKAAAPDPRLALSHA